ncbi:MAG: hypothetical protein Q9166_004720 [cf. Caloplaca sp. 2 TL-2023]
MSWQQLNLYYLDLEGHVVERYTKDGESWEDGSLSNQDIIPSPNSDLAAIWTQTDQTACNKCGDQNALLAYQDSSYKIWVVNVTGPSPRLTMLEADPTPGTGLAFQSVWHEEGSPGIRIYYQKGADDLITIDYESDYGSAVTGNTAWDWTLHEDTPIGSVSGGASIASFSWGDDSMSGNPLFQHTLSSSLQGVNVAWLGGGPYTDKGWHTETPDVMKDIQAYSALAANADRHVYALEAGTVKEFVVSTDGLTWSLVGDVPTKN